MERGPGRGVSRPGPLWILPFCGGWQGEICRFCPLHSVAFCKLRLRREGSWRGMGKCALKASDPLLSPSTCRCAARGHPLLCPARGRLPRRDRRRAGQPLGRRGDGRPLNSPKEMESRTAQTGGAGATEKADTFVSAFSAEK
ncbi:hypothetical protein HMPREF0262_00583 [Clostridium sp. ATCC 29733]|nr:hypothetical protein HMPREF0262_00583 [Clostridium sp. ATCC 29733]